MREVYAIMGRKDTHTTRMIIHSIIRQRGGEKVG